MIITKRTYFTMKDCGLAGTDLYSAMKDVSGNDYIEALSEGIYERYYFNWFQYVDQDMMDDSEAIYSEDKIEAFLIHIRSIYRLTYPKYVALLHYYDKVGDDLMAKLESTTKTKFNDTPQNAGNFSGEQYTTTYTEVDTAADPYPIADRLSAVQDMYKNLMRDWVNEFKALFGEETV